MNQKTLRLFIFIFLVFLAVALWPTLKSRLPRSAKEAPLPFADFTKATTAKVAIKQTDQEIVLIRNDSSWLVTDATFSAQSVADSDAISKFFTTLLAATDQTLVSTNPDNQEQYLIADSTALFLTLEKSGQVTKFAIGKIGPDYNSFYGRLADNSRVYLVRSNLRQQLTEASDFWKQKSTSSTPSATPTTEKTE